MEVHKLFWLLGEQANMNYDKMPSLGLFQGNISRLYLNEVTKYMSWYTIIRLRIEPAAPAQSRQLTAGYRRR